MDTTAPSPPHKASRTVFITGASSGLGLALARAFASEQANVGMLARSEVTLKQAAAALGAPAARILTVAADVSDRAAAQHAVERVIEHFGRIDVLINCAGEGWLGPLADLPIEVARRLLGANLLGPIHVVRAALPTLRANPGSSIVFVSSLLGLRAFPRSAVYSAAKFGIVGLAEALRMELKRDGIHVLTVCPGRLDTAFLDKAHSVDGKRGLRAERPMDPDEVAAKMLRAIRARKRMLIVPFSARVLYWANLWCPGVVDHLLWKRFQREGLL